MQPVPPPPTHYEMLQVAEDADAAVIRASFKALVQKYHPDRYKPKAEGEYRLRGINIAFAIVGDADKRVDYDRYLAGQRSEAKRRAAASVRSAEQTKAKLQQRFGETPPLGAPAPAPIRTITRVAPEPVLHVVIQAHTRRRARARKGLLILAAGAVLLGFCVRDRLDWTWLGSVHGAPAAGSNTRGPGAGGSASRWSEATAEWQRTHREFASDPHRLRSMQSAIDRIDLETGGSLPDKELIARAQREAYRATGWRGSGNGHQGADGPHIRSQHSR